MQLTLSRFQIALESEIKNPFAVKSRLTKWKQEGVWFYNENIALIDENTPFHAYYYLKPSSTSFVNAFPVPRAVHLTHCSDYQQYLFLKHYFESYYPNHPFTYKEFTKYNLDSPYLAKRFVWYFKK